MIYPEYCVKKSILAVILILIITCAHANEWSGNINLFLGKKLLDSDEWAPVDEQDEFGILVDFKKNHWPVSIALDLLLSADETTEYGINFEGETSEFNAGVRKIWKVSGSSMRPYIGGGYSLVRAEWETTGAFSQSDSDKGSGIWLNCGIYWTLLQSFNIGLDLRYTNSEITLFSTWDDAGGTHAGLFLGYHW